MIKHIILKATGECNLSCNYCYYENNIIPQWKQKFELSLLENLFSKLKSYNRNVAISWHGGEPLLNGIKYFDDALVLAKKNDLLLTNSLQTNGTLLNSEWAVFFKRNNFSIGVSIDGNEYHNFLAGRFGRSNSLYKKVIEGVSVLQGEEVKYGVLCVANSRFEGKEVFEHFLDMGIKNMDFLIPISTQQVPDVEIEGLIRYYTSIFDIWFKNDDKEISIRLFEDILLLILGGKSQNCLFKNSCNRFITIEPNGDIGMCENTRVISIEEYLLGLNIEHNTLIEADSVLNNMYEEIKILPLECNDCSFMPMCNGGCPVGRKNGNYQNINVYCMLYKALFSHILNKVKPIKS